MKKALEESFLAIGICTTAVVVLMLIATLWVSVFPPDEPEQPIKEIQYPQKFNLPDQSAEEFLFDYPVREI